MLAAMAYRGIQKSVQAHVAVLTVLAALAALFGAFVWPLIASGTGSGGGPPDPARITDYRVEITVDDDGTLRARETLEVEMPSWRHGIFRYFDVHDGADPRGRALPRDITVTADGEPVPVAWSWEDGRRFRVAKIGDPVTYLTEGPHTYEIAWRIDGVLAEPGSRGDSGTWSGNEGSEFVWDVVPGGWAMPIEKMTGEITLPAEPLSPQCASLGQCTVEADGSTLTVSASQLAPYTPVTVGALVDTEPAPGLRLPWPPWLDPVFGRNVLGALVVAALALLALVLGWLLTLRTRERAPGFPVLFEPPAGLGPVATAYITTETLPSNAVSATLLHLAERGFVKLDHDSNNRWTVTGLKSAPEWEELDELSRKVGRSLGVATQHSHFAVDGSVGAGQKLSSLSTTLPREAREWAIAQGLLTRTPGVPFARLILGVAFLVAILCAWVQPFGIGLATLVPAAFVVGGVGLMRPPATTHRTATGRDAWSRAGGFRRMLATDSAEARFDFSARKELYTSYIPYAVAFGVADRWAAKYQAETGEPAPVPAWYGAGYATGGGGWGGATLGIASFDAALDSSIGAYAATQSSSGGGGGGGGFSGGGGGGGGGGGSW